MILSCPNITIDDIIIDYCLYMKRCMHAYIMPINP